MQHNHRIEIEINKDEFKKKLDLKDGKDGYTPIKGVDYFDGEKGDSIKGENGKDGYTPIKGVDYFDGEKGEKGDPGKDGNIPKKLIEEFKKKFKKYDDDKLLWVNNGALKVVAHDSTLTGDGTDASPLHAVGDGVGDMLKATYDPTNKHQDIFAYTDAGLALKVTANAGISGATKTKITYDAKGLVTAGADATTSDIAEGSNLYYTQARFNTAFAAKTTADLTENTNLYFTNARGIAAVLTGYTSGAGTVAATDTILQAIQKLNGNTAALVTGVSSVNSLTGAVALTGTANRITISAANVFDISASYVGQSSITTVGTIVSGTWSGSFGAVSGANLTNLTAGNLAGTIPSSVLGNSSLFIGTTSIALNRSSSSQALTGITSIDGSAATLTTPRTIGGVSFNGSANITVASATGGFAISGGDLTMATNKITGLGDPTNAQDAATKNYVDSVATGMDVKASVRLATTANITLSGTQTIDGVSAIAGDRVLVKNQTTGANNGIYVVASGSWARSTDADTSAEVTSGLFTFVTEGTTNGNTGWVLTTDDPITLGTTALVFAQFAGVGTFTAGNGLSLSGTQFSIDTTITVDKTTAQTLTNKTLTTPFIASLYQDAGATKLLTMPAATDTLVGKATTDIFTNKTFDTAGTGNVFKINGTSITDKTGTGKAVLDTSPTFTTTMTVTGTAQGALGTYNNGAESSYLEFSRNGDNAKGTVGHLGSAEMNIAYNMDYKTSVHKYYDSTQNAFWFAMNSGGVYLQYAPSGYGGTDIWTGQGSLYNWQIDTSGNEILRGTSTSTGLVINSAAATNSLATYEINGTIYGYYGIAGGSANVIANSVLGDTVIRSQAKNILFSTDSGVTAHVYIKNGGNVGIGSVNPLQLLHIMSPAATNALTLYAVNTTSYGYYGISGGTDNVIAGSVIGDTIIRSEAKNILFSTDSGVTAHMYIKNGGNVGIGTTAPDALLHVKGASNSNIFLHVDANGTGSGAFYFSDDGTIRTYFGMAGTADGIVTGAAAGDTVIRSQGKAIHFTTDSGNNISMSLNSSGNLFLKNLITTYNNINTVSNGIPSEIATIDSTGLTANVGATTLYSVPSTGAGMYRVSAYLVTTTAGSISSTMPNAQIVFTDKDSNTSVTLDASPVLGAAGEGQSGLLTANTVGTVFSGEVVLYVKASTTIQYQTVNYASNLAGMAYALHIKLEAL